MTSTGEINTRRLMDGGDKHGVEVTRETHQRHRPRGEMDPLPSPVGRYWTELNSYMALCRVVSYRSL